MYSHQVRITFGESGESGAGLEGDQIKGFEFSTDMLELADDFSMTAQLTRKSWEMATPDTVVRVFVDDSQMLEGFIDEREAAGDRENGRSLSIFGRDKGGRLVDESAPFIVYGGLDLDELVKRLVAPWFPSVTLSNARNRLLAKGRGRRSARVGAEPIVVSDRKISKKVEPGETIADVLGFFLERARLLGWSSADGREFIVGKPNYEQAPQFFFFQGAADSARWQETNVESSTYTETVAQRYSEIQAVGSNRGDADNYGPNVTRRTATLKSNALLHRKRLVVSDDDVRSAAEAEARALREMAVRDAGGRMLVLQVAGFGQALGGDVEARPALFTCDTMARWEDEELGVRGDYLITKVRFSRSKSEGDRAELSLVPRGTELIFR